MVRGRPGWGDLVVAAAIALIALALLAARAWLVPVGREAVGREAVVTTPDGSFVLPLGEDTVRTVDGNDGIAVVIAVEGGSVRFVSSGCPDQICVRSGSLTKAGDTAACVPAGVSVRLMGEAEVDAVAG